LKDTAFYSRDLDNSSPPSPSPSDPSISEMEDVDDEHHTHHPVRKSIRQAFGTLTMMLSASQILYCYVCEPDSLNKSYLSFLITHGRVRALQPNRAREYLNIFVPIILEGSNSGQSKFIPGAASFAESIPKSIPNAKILPFSGFLTQVPNEFIMVTFV
jgi:hypothetical protein